MSNKKYDIYEMQRRQKRAHNLYTTQRQKNKELVEDSYKRYKEYIENKNQHPYNENFEFLEQLSNNDSEIVKQLFHCIFYSQNIFTPTKKTYHSRDEVMAVYKRQQLLNPHNAIQQNIYLTSKELNMTHRAVQKHIYKNIK